MRYAPKSYIRLIYENGGFALLFETQIYELGQIELVKRINEVTGLPVICTTSIPDGIIDRFEKWHKTKVKVWKSVKNFKKSQKPINSTNKLQYPYEYYNAWCLVSNIDQLLTKIETK